MNAVPYLDIAQICHFWRRLEAYQLPYYHLDYISHMPLDRSVEPSQAVGSAEGQNAVL